MLGFVVVEGVCGVIEVEVVDVDFVEECEAM